MLTQAAATSHQLNAYTRDARKDGERVVVDFCSHTSGGHFGDIAGRLLSAGLVSYGPLFLSNDLARLSFLTIRFNMVQPTMVASEANDRKSSDFPKLQVLCLGSVHITGTRMLQTHLQGPLHQLWPVWHMTSCLRCFVCRMGFYNQSLVELLKIQIITSKAKCLVHNHLLKALQESVRAVASGLMNELEAILHEYLSFNWDRVEEVLESNRMVLNGNGLSIPWPSHPSLSVCPKVRQ